VLQTFRDWKVVREGDAYKMAFEPDTPGAVSAASLPVMLTQTYVGVQLGQSELGRLGVHGDVYWGIPGNRVGGGGSDVSYAVGISPTVLKPDNRSANEKLALDSAFRSRVTVIPAADGRRAATRTEGAGAGGGAGEREGRVDAIPVAPSAIRGAAGAAPDDAPR
jgi:hypothetical protein